MDRKSILILVVCFGLILAWQPLMNKIWPPVPAPKAPTNTVATVTGTNGALTATNPPPQWRAVAPAPFVAPAGPEQTLVITNGPARYTFTSHGGGLKEVELFNFPDLPPGRSRVAPTNFVMLNVPSTAPVLASLDAALNEGNQPYRLSRTATGVRAEKTLPSGLAVVKDFELTTNYLIRASVRLTNAADAPIALAPQRWVTGTAVPLNQEDTGMTLGLMWFDGKSATEISQPWFDNRTLGCFPGTPRTEYVAGRSNVVWAAARNQFFALIAMPRDPAHDVFCRVMNVPRPATWDAHGKVVAPTIRVFETAVEFPAANLAPGQVLTRDLLFYAGPKEFRILTRVADRLGNQVDLVMGYGGFFGFFAKVLLLSMNGLHDLLHLGYGWVIILITIIIKAVFWPLTAFSTRSMKRMQALQPEMKKIQEKYKDDPAKMNRKTMEFMREHKVSPLGGCLPMLIQLPIFFGFYRMIQSAIELRGESFLWVQDLSRPDTLFYVAGMPFNLLPLIMGVTMLWQARLTPMSPTMDATQQKLMKYMPLMFLFILYNFSAGLTLYWTVQNLLSILQTKLTKTQTLTPATTVPAPAHPPRKRAK